MGISADHGTWISKQRIAFALAGACAFAACTHSNYLPNVIQLTPNGTAAHPADESIDAPFTLKAIEDGYNGQFTAATIVGQCWVVQAPITTSGAWIVSPEGLTCPLHDIEKIQVTDTNGRSAVTYIHAI